MEFAHVRENVVTVDFFSGADYYPIVVSFLSRNVSGHVFAYLRGLIGTFNKL